MSSQWLFIANGPHRTSLMQSVQGEGKVRWLDAPPTAENLASGELVVDFLPEDEHKREALMAMARCAEWDGMVASMIEKNSAAYWAFESGLGGRLVGFSMPPGAGKTFAVELFRGEVTSPKAVDLVSRVFKALNWHVTVCRDQTGGILFRVLAGMINEAAFTVQSGIATVDQIDRMMRLAANFPMGPFAWADQIGLDRVLSLLEVLKDEVGSIYHPCPMIRRKVESGQLGQKTGQGFYVYSQNEVHNETN